MDETKWNATKRNEMENKNKSTSKLQEKTTTKKKKDQKMKGNQKNTHAT